MATYWHAYCRLPNAASVIGAVAGRWMGTDKNSGTEDVQGAYVCFGAQVLMVLSLGGVQGHAGVRRTATKPREVGALLF